MRGWVGRVASNLDQLGPQAPQPRLKVYTPLPLVPKLPPPEFGQGRWGSFVPTKYTRLNPPPQ
jgi:hypothetical protein